MLQQVQIQLCGPQEYNHGMSQLVCALVTTSHDSILMAHMNEHTLLNYIMLDSHPLLCMYVSWSTHKWLLPLIPYKYWTRLTSLMFFFFFFVTSEVHVSNCICSQVCTIRVSKPLGSTQFIGTYCHFVFQNYTMP